MSRPVGSPRLQRLRHAIDSGDRGAIDAFWRGVEADGAPLVEPIEGDPGHRLLTFLWRDTRGDTHNVLVLGGPARWEPIEADALEPLEGTDVWFRTYRVRSDLRTRYVLSPNDPLTPHAVDTIAEWLVRSKTFRPDPLNPSQIVWPANDGDPLQPEERFSLVELPDAPPQAWATPRSSAPAGAVELHRVRSDVLGNERRIWVHRPAGVDRTSGMLVLFDGWVWGRALPIAPTLDNLVAEGTTPPLTTLMVDAIDMDGIRETELSCHRPFLDFLVKELLPWAAERWGPTPAAGRCIVAGQSLGGLTASFAGLEMPDVFGNVLSQSGSFWWKRDSELDLQREWLAQEVARRPRAPVRFFLEVGLLEGPDMVFTNRHLRDVLVARGYELGYREYYGGHWWHDWLGGIADGLTTLTAPWD